MNQPHCAPRAERREFVARLIAAVPEALIVSGLGSASYDVFAAGDRERNYYLWGAMGGAAALGLGLALAQPDKPVLVITGDGEQLMGIGSLGSIAAKQPKNLTIVVLDNGHFGETGMQRSHSGLGVRMEAIAEASGFAAASMISEMAEVAAYRPRLQDLSAGPRFVRLRIAPGNPERALPPRDGVFVKNRFRQNLGFPVV